MEENILGKVEQQPTQETPQVVEPVVEQPIQTYKAPKTRGRPISKAKLKAQRKVARYYGEQVTEPEIPQATREQPKRKERIPFGVPQQSVITPKNDGYVYRVFNDNWSREPDRIQRALDAGYEKVRDVRARGTNEDGSAIEGVLMRIPKELYESDQKLKQEENDKIDREIRRGKFQEKPGDKRYVPSSGISIESKINP